MKLEKLCSVKLELQTVLQLLNNQKNKKLAIFRITY